MNDRELLELAAKAAGIVGTSVTTLGGVPAIRINPHDLTPWNPLTDDGDALRLAMKLLIQIYPDKDEVEIFHMEIGYIVEPTNGDVLDATRRAIVRAAAEIGKGIQIQTAEGVLEDNYYKSQAEAEELGRQMQEGGAA